MSSRHNPNKLTIRTAHTGSAASQSFTTDDEAGARADDSTWLVQYRGPRPMSQADFDAHTSHFTADEKSQLAEKYLRASSTSSSTSKLQPWQKEIKVIELTEDDEKDLQADLTNADATSPTIGSRSSSEAGSPTQRDHRGREPSLQRSPTSPKSGSPPRRASSRFSQRSVTRHLRTQRSSLRLVTNVTDFDQPGESSSTNRESGRILTDDPICDEPGHIQEETEDEDYTEDKGKGKEVEKPGE